ncbi:MAG: Rieske 2Fe-2S domain-containing protein [Actinomycetia bacterium]|nr:Rieske 2Fe-2S domain-containing protein [Actinomycetes bacterium]
METSTILFLAIPVLVVLAVVVLVAASRSRDTFSAIGRLSRETERSDAASTALGEAAAPLTGKEVERLARVGTLVPVVETAAPPAPYIPPDEETLGVHRRQFLNRSIVSFFGLGLAGFGGACIAMLWPKAGGGFGSAIVVGQVDAVKETVNSNDGFFYAPEGRMWIVEYPDSAIDDARDTYSEAELGGMEKGLLALYQKCPHLGCRVPSCLTSQWFECPCHGSQFNRVGEKRGGPAPRGMDRFSMSINDRDEFVVDTGTIVPGPPIGTDTTKQSAEGPNCISSSAGHG